MQLSIFVSPTRWERTVVVEEVLYTFGVVFLVRFSYGVRVPTRFGALAVSCKNFKQSKWPFMAAFSHASLSSSN